MCVGSAEPHAVPVAMGVRSLVEISVRIGIADLSEDDHACGASVDAERTACAHVVIDGEDDIVCGIEAGLLGTDCLVNC